MLSFFQRIPTLALVAGAPLAAGTVPGPDCPPVAAAVPLTAPTVLGNGTPGSVTTAQIQAALDAGGEVLLDQGPSPTTIALTAELVATREVVLDGGGLVTLSGGGVRRVLRIENPTNAFFTVTLQGLGIADGATPGASGAGVFKPSGGPWQAVSLVVVDSWFTDNVAIAVDEDGGGGAVYAIGMDEVRFHGTRFEGNRGSNGGAVYSLGSDVVAFSDAVLDDNHATGDGGNPGNGGNGGAVGVDGAERDAVFCRVEMLGNRANAFGAGFFSVMYDLDSLTSFNAVTFDDNRNETDFGLAGGAYVQGGPFVVHNSTFTANRAPGAGGAFLGPGAVGEIVNSTFSGNVATEGLGGGIYVSTDEPVGLGHVTVAENLAPCDVCFAAGILVDEVNAVTMTSSILADNVGGNEFNPWNIRHEVGDGGGNLQWPDERPNGQPEQPATATVVWADPLLLPLADYGGPTETRALDPTSPAIDGGVDVGAPPRDQRGFARSSPVDAGAVEGSSPEIFADAFETGDTSAWSTTVD